MKLYVAYGSNLNIAQMQARCPHATIYSSAILSNWELIYRGTPTNSHATIRRKKGSIIPVLVWSITNSDEQRLDIYEGYPSYYYKQNIMVNINGLRKKAIVYIMNKSCLPGRPSARYVNTIRQGYYDNGFDLNILLKSLELNRCECI